MSDRVRQSLRRAKAILAGWTSPGRGFRPRAGDRNGEHEDLSAASYGRLALQMERDLPEQGRGRSILIVSADDDSVGLVATTELAWHLAGDLGRRVLLVDATFTRGVLSTAMGFHDQPGLTELLVAMARGEVPLRAVICPTPHQGIALLSRGAVDNSVLIPVRVEAVQRLLKAACEAFDFVLVQGSILMESNRSLVFGAQVDAVLLVATEQKTSEEDVQRGRRILNDCGAGRVGLVLESPPRKRPVNGS